MPPSHYPPTAPYTNLSAHFAKQVRKGVLRSTIVKLLLYPQTRQSIDRKSILMRRKRTHKSALKLQKSQRESGENFGISKRSEIERQNAFEFFTDSESDDAESVTCDSNPFEYIKFYANKRDSIYYSTGTFIDHGLHCGSSINLINLDSTSIENEAGILPKTHKESLIIGSKAVRAITRNSSDQSVPLEVHTSTAHFDLGASVGINSTQNLQKPLKQPHLSHLTLQPQLSDTSQISSVFGGHLGGAYLACENLACLADETKIKIPKRNLVNEVYSPIERHSMPNIFVGNRFNRSSKTEVYVPSWKDRNEMQKQSIDRMDQGMPTEEIHSSSLDLPAACFMAPDQLQAELLYNFDECLSVNSSREHIIAPPSMFKQPVSLLEAAKRVSLQRHEGSFRKHALNSDKRLSRRDNGKHGIRLSNENLSSSASDNCIETRNKQILLNREASTGRSSIRRCISYQFVQMSTAPSIKLSNRDGTIASRSSNSCNNSTRSPKCKCCESSQCPSPRSSDSGMAGSCTIASPDPPNPHSNNVVEEGNIPGRDGNLSSEFDLMRFGVCGRFRQKFLTPQNNEDLIEYVTNVPLNCQATPLPNLPMSVNSKISSVGNQIQINTKSIFLSTTGVTATCDNELDLPLKCNAENLDSNTTEEPDTATTSMFRSGMYAHWWKKEKLPAAVVHSIAHMCNKSQPTSDFKRDSIECVLEHGCNRSLSIPQTSKDLSRCSMCSTCMCSISASGYSEGTTYCSICAECSSFCSGATEATGTTNTTTTISSSSTLPLDCPLCSQQAPVTRTAHGGQLTAVSPSSSYDCFVCCDASGIIDGPDEDSKLVAEVEQNFVAQASEGKH